MTHLAAAALLGHVTRLSPFWLVAGAAVPDLLDKPLATLGVVDLFHSVGHSALLLVVMVPVALTGRTGLAAAVGWGSHLLLDAVHVVSNGRPGDAAFLAWPVIVPSDPLRLPPGEFFLYYIGTPMFFVEVAFWVALLGAVTVRWARGRPTVDPDD